MHGQFFQEAHSEIIHSCLSRPTKRSDVSCSCMNIKAICRCGLSRFAAAGSPPSRDHHATNVKMMKIVPSMMCGKIMAFMLIFVGDSTPAMASHF
jgi:hypothetical protein